MQDLRGRLAGYDGEKIAIYGLPIDKQSSFLTGPAEAPPAHVPPEPTTAPVEIQRARRYDRPLTVAIMDLDHFKRYNDTCGHPAGDRALAKVGDILRTALREVDIVARHGGEEFAVILPETSPAAMNGTKEPFPFLERLRQKIEETAFEGEEQLPGGNLTVSVGVACFPSDADTAEDLFQKADDALYASKGHGRNVVTYRGRPVTD